MTRIETSSSASLPYVLPAIFDDRPDDVLEEVGVVVGQLALRDRRDRSSPAPVSMEGLGSGVSLPSALRSNCMKTRFQISSQRSQSQATPSHFLPAFSSAQGISVALEEVDLRAGAARAGVAHRPEVVLHAQLEDPLGRNALCAPEVEGLLVPGQPALAVEDGGREPVLRDPEPLLGGDELPRPLDRVALEVVAEGEVAEHLEEGVVARREADVLQVVVLPAGPHALLGGRRPRVVALLLPREDVLELDHPRVGEEEGRVVLRHEPGGGDAAVAALLEEAEEELTDLGGGQGLHVSVRKGSNRLK